MKKFFIFFFFLAISLPCFCEAIKLKNGLIINGSIIDRSEYILKVKTSYGTIALNQREVDKIMPDLHRVLMKGGGEYVGTVVDLDDFNLTLNTDNGLINIDVAQIRSMEIYDYEEAAKQKKYVENKIEQEERTEEENKQKILSATNMDTSGLSFDDDLEKVFPSKPKEEEIKYIYKTHEDTLEQLQAAAEEKEAKEALTPAEQEQKRKEEELSFNQNKKRKEGKNYFSVQAGLLKSSLQVDLTEFAGPIDFDLSGNGAGFGISYLRKFSRHLWLGGNFSFGMLPKKSTIYPYSTTPGEDREIEVGGQVYDLNALFNFYINTKQPLRVYLTGGAGISSIAIDNSYSDCYQKSPGVWDWKPIEKRDKSFTAFHGSVGMGLEWTIDDINLAFETRFKFMPLKDELEKSSKTSVFITLKTSWFF